MMLETKRIVEVFHLSVTANEGTINEEEIAILCGNDNSKMTADIKIFPTDDIYNRIKLNTTTDNEIQNILTISPQVQSPNVHSQEANPNDGHLSLPNSPVSDISTPNSPAEQQLQLEQPFSPPQSPQYLPSPYNDIVYSPGLVVVNKVELQAMFAAAEIPRLDRIICQCCYRISICSGGSL